MRKTLVVNIRQKEQSYVNEIEIEKAVEKAREAKDFRQELLKLDRIFTKNLNESIGSDRFIYKKYRDKVRGLMTVRMPAGWD
jgi:hypothetical protein